MTKTDEFEHFFEGLLKTNPSLKNSKKIIREYCVRFKIDVTSQWAPLEIAQAITSETGLSQELLLVREALLPIVARDGLNEAEDNLPPTKK